jgi:gamma-glutamyltranspeptidase
VTALFSLSRVRVDGIHARDGAVYGHAEPLPEVPVAELLSPERAAEHRARIAADQVLRWPFAVTPIAGLTPFTPSAAIDAEADELITGTTTFQIVDRDGNAASVTTSLGAQFYVMGDTGIHINNRFIKDGEFDITLARPIGRCGALGDYVEVKEVFQMVRPGS